MCTNRSWLDTGAALTVEVTIFPTITRRIKNVLWCFKTFAGTQKPLECGYAVGHCCYITPNYALRKTEIGLEIKSCYSSTINSPSTDASNVMISSLEKLVCVMW
jgi:hypothetical protein